VLPFDQYLLCLIISHLTSDKHKKNVVFAAFICLLASEKHSWKILQFLLRAAAAGIS
jgi:hypothetical protein